MDIRNYIKSNFNDLNKDKIKESIVESIKSREEVILPGLGVFFEILWNNSNDKYKEYILSTIKNNI